MKYSLQNQETHRLRFRLLQPSDFDTWKALFLEKEAIVNLGFDPNLSADSICQLWFDKTFQRYREETGAMNVLIEKETGAFVGQCGLLEQIVAGEPRLEIGYSILPKFWGKGFASEAACKCKEYAFENKLTNALISIVYIHNEASKKVAIKNGMHFEKRLENYQGMPVEIFCVTKDYLT